MTNPDDLPCCSTCNAAMTEQDKRMLDGYACCRACIDELKDRLQAAREWEHEDD